MAGLRIKSSAAPAVTAEQPVRRRGGMVAAVANDDAPDAAELHKAMPAAPKAAAETEAKLTLTKAGVVKGLDVSMDGGKTIKTLTNMRPDGSLITAADGREIRAQHALPAKLVTMGPTGKPAVAVEANWFGAPNRQTAILGTASVTRHGDGPKGADVKLDLFRSADGAVAATSLGLDSPQKLSVSGFHTVDPSGRPVSFGIQYDGAGVPKGLLGQVTQLDGSKKQVQYDLAPISDTAKFPKGAFVGQLSDLGVRPADLGGHKMILVKPQPVVLSASGENMVTEQKLVGGGKMTRMMDSGLTIRADHYAPGGTLTQSVIALVRRNPAGEPELTGVKVTRPDAVDFEGSHTRYVTSAQGLRTAKEFGINADAKLRPDSLTTPASTLKFGYNAQGVIDRATGWRDGRATTEFQVMTAAQIDAAKVPPSRVKGQLSALGLDAKDMGGLDLRLVKPESTKWVKDHLSPRNGTEFAAKLKEMHAGQRHASAYDWQAFRSETAVQLKTTASRLPGGKWSVSPLMVRGLAEMLSTKHTPGTVAQRNALSKALATYGRLPTAKQVAPADRPSLAFLEKMVAKHQPRAPKAKVVPAERVPLVEVKQTPHQRRVALAKSVVGKVVGQVRTAVGKVLGRTAPLAAPVVAPKPKLSNMQQSKAMLDDMIRFYEGRARGPTALNLAAMEGLSKADRQRMTEVLGMSYIDRHHFRTKAQDVVNEWNRTDFDDQKSASRSVRKALDAAQKDLAAMTALDQLDRDASRAGHVLKDLRATRDKLDGPDARHVADALMAPLNGVTIGKDGVKVEDPWRRSVPQSVHLPQSGDTHNGQRMVQKPSVTSLTDARTYIADITSHLRFQLEGSQQALASYSSADVENSVEQYNEIHNIRSEMRRSVAATEVLIPGQKDQWQSALGVRDIGNYFPLLAQKQFADATRLEATVSAHKRALDNLSILNHKLTMIEKRTERNGSYDGDLATRRIAEFSEAFGSPERAGNAFVRVFGGITDPETMKNVTPTGWSRNARMENPGSFEARFFAVEVSTGMEQDDGVRMVHWRDF